jgi:hypothetical protein
MPSFLDNLNQFDPATIERGRTYYEKGRVTLAHVDPHRVEAFVEGTERYRVLLNFDGKKKMISSRCDCPCQFPCKHVVAVLYALERQAEAAVATPLSAEPFALSVEKAEKRGSDFDLFTLGQAFLLKLPSLEKKEKDEDLRHYFKAYSILQGNSRYDFRGLSSRLLQVAGYSEPESRDFFTSFLEDPEISFSAKKCLLVYFFDAGGVGKVFDEAFLRYCQADDSRAERFFADGFFAGAALQQIPDSLLDYLLRRLSLRFSPYEIQNRFPPLEKGSSPEAFHLYLSLVQALKNQEALDFAPREGVELFQKLGHLDEAKEMARLYFESSLSLADYQSYRAFLSSPLEEKSLREIVNIASNSPSFDAIALYESQSTPTFPEAELSRISLSDFALIGSHFLPARKEEIEAVIEAKFASALTRVKTLPEAGEGLLALASINPEKAKSLLKDPHLFSQSAEEDSFRVIYLSLLQRFDLVESVGFVSYPKEAPHVS